ncbi:MAG: T9SS type A sorting domain-containing protein, partial [Bacteroidota bacterium]
GEEAPQYANQTTFTPDEDGTYFASVTYATGCTTLSNAQRYFINVGGGGPLGTDDEVLELVIYPNPTDGGLILQIPSDWVGSADITLINSIGQTMLSQHIEATESLQEVRFDISGYASGAYIIQVQTAEGTFAEKVIKR